MLRGGLLAALPRPRTGRARRRRQSIGTTRRKTSRARRRLVEGRPRQLSRRPPRSPGPRDRSSRSRVFKAGMRSGRLDTSVGRAPTSGFPSIEERFTDADGAGSGRAAGLLVQRRFARGRLPRPAGQRARRRLLRRHVARSTPISTSIATASAPSTCAAAVLPIFDKKRVFAVQGRLQSAATDSGAGQTVPFYFKPTLGGSTSHRGVQRLPLSRRHRCLSERRVPLGSVLGPRHGALHRLGQGRADVGRARLSRPRARLRHRVSLQHLQGGLVPRRHRLAAAKASQTFFKFSKAF